MKNIYFKSFITFVILFCSNSIVFSQGDDCASATPLTVNTPVSPVVTNINTALATSSAQSDDFSCSLGTGLQDYYFTFTMPGGATDLTLNAVNLTGPSSYLQTAIWDVCGGASGGATQLYCSNNSLASTVISGLVSGTTYIIQFGSDPSETGSFDISLLVPFAVNNYCSTPTSLVVYDQGNAVPTTLSTLTANSSSLSDDFSCQVGSGLHDLYYTFTMPTDFTDVNLLTNNLTGPNAYLQVVVWDSCGGLSGGSVESFCSNGVNFVSTITNLTPGASYILQVGSDPSNNELGNFSIGLETLPPSNQTCADARAMTVYPPGASVPSYYNASEASSSAQSDDFSCAFVTAGNLQDLYYTFTTPPGVTSVNLLANDLAVTNTYLQAVVWNTCGGASGGAVEYFCTSSVNSAQTISGLTGGTTYILQVGCDPTEIGDFELALELLPCGISDLSSGTQTVCDPVTNTYSQDVTVTFVSPPSTGMLSVNGETVAIGTSPQTVTLTGLPANGTDVDVTAFFTALGSCTYTESAVFTAPANCSPVPCDIQAFSTGSQSNCDPVTNTYSQDITVSYVGAPTIGMLDVNGQTFPIETSPQALTLTGLIADGLPVDLTASFTADPTCSYSENNVFIAALSCVPCNISAISSGIQSLCDSTTNTYSSVVTVTYLTPPVSGMLDVNGQTFAIGTSPQTVTLTNLPADGLPVDITASFTDDIACTLTENAAFTAPGNCSPTAIKDLNLSSLQLSPNPNKGRFSLSFNVDQNRDLSFKLLNILGQTVDEQFIYNAQGNIVRNYEMSHLDKGIYLLEIFDGSEKVVLKVLIE